MALQMCLSLSHNNLFKPTALFSNSLLKPSHHQRFNEPQRETFLSMCLSKRELGLSALTLFLHGFLPNLPSAISAEDLVLERYTDSNEGFTLLKPSSWIKVRLFKIITSFLCVYDCIKIVAFKVLLEVVFFFFFFFYVNNFGWFMDEFRLIKQGQLFCLKKKIRGVTVLGLW